MDYLSYLNPNRPQVRYKRQHSFEERHGEAINILTSFPGRIPIIIDQAQTATSLPEIDKRKFLCPGDITIGQLLYVIRKRLQLEPEHALFLYVGGRFLPPSSALLSQVYQEHKDEDGFLYVIYATENVFG